MFYNIHGFAYETLFFCLQDTLINTMIISKYFYLKFIHHHNKGVLVS